MLADEMASGVRATTPGVEGLNGTLLGLAIACRPFVAVGWTCRSMWRPRSATAPSGETGGDRSGPWDEGLLRAGGDRSARFHQVCQAAGLSLRRLRLFGFSRLAIAGSVLLGQVGFPSHDPWAQRRRASAEAQRTARTGTAQRIGKRERRPDNAIDRAAPSGPWRHLPWSDGREPRRVRPGLGAWEEIDRAASARCAMVSLHSPYVGRPLSKVKPKFSGRNLAAAFSLATNDQRRLSFRNLVASY